MALSPLPFNSCTAPVSLQAEFGASQRLVQMAGNPYITFDDPVTAHDLVGHDIQVSQNRQQGGSNKEQPKQSTPWEQ